MSASDGGGFRVREAEAVTALVGFIRRYGSIEGGIFALIGFYLLNGILDIVGIVVGSILFAFDLVVESLATAQRLLIGAFGAAGIDILSALVGLQRAIAGVVEGAGPAAPIVAVGFGAIALYLTWLLVTRLAVGLIGELPGGSTLVDLLNLR